MYRSAPIKEGQLVRRSLAQRDLVVDQDARTVELSFASDFEVERYDWVERLLMTGMDMSRIGSGKAALLMDHDSRDQVGVVESVTVGSDNIARAKVRFSRSARGQEIFQDVVDGIRSLVSVGYRIHEIELAGSKDGVSTYEVTRWEPYEISIVSIPADPTVGVGRSADLTVEKPVIEAAPEIAPEPVAEARSLPASPKSKESIVDEIQIQKAASDAATKRTLEIMSTAERFSAPAEMVREFIGNGKSVDEFKIAILERAPAPKPLNTSATVSSGITERDLAKYDLKRAILAMADGNFTQAGFEREISQTLEKEGKRSARGLLIPGAVFATRASQQKKSVAADGGALVETNFLADGYIQALRNRLLVNSLGARVRSGLVGEVAFPKKTGKTAGGWINEDESAPVTKAQFGQVTMTPKTVAAETSLSRRLLIQSSIDVEADIRSDIIASIAEMIDVAALIGGDAKGPVGLLAALMAAPGTPGIISLGTNGGAIDWDRIVEMETRIAAANADVNTMGYVTNAKVRGKLKTTLKAANTGTFLWSDGQDGFGSLNGYRAGVTNQIPGSLTKGTGTNLSAMLFGDFSQCNVGVWSEVDIQVDPYTLGATGAVVVRAFQDADVAFGRLESFSGIRDIVTA